MRIFLDEESSQCLMEVLKRLREKIINSDRQLVFSWDEHLYYRRRKLLRLFAKINSQLLLRKINGELSYELELIWEKYKDIGKVRMYFYPLGDEEFALYSDVFPECKVSGAHLMDFLFSNNIVPHVTDLNLPTGHFTIDHQPFFFFILECNGIVRNI